MLKFVIYIHLSLTLCLAFKAFLSNDIGATCHMIEGSQDHPATISLYTSSTVKVPHFVLHADSILNDFPTYDEITSSWGIPSEPMLVETAPYGGDFKLSFDNENPNQEQASMNIAVQTVHIEPPSDEIISVLVEITHSFGELTYEAYRTYQQFKYILCISIALCTYLYTKSASFASKAVLKYGIGLYILRVMLCFAALLKLNRFGRDPIPWTVFANNILQEVTSSLASCFQLQLALGFGLFSKKFKLSFPMILQLFIVILSPNGYHFVWVAMDWSLLIFTFYICFETKKRMEDRKSVAILKRTMLAMYLLPIIISKFGDLIDILSHAKRML